MRFVWGDQEIKEKLRGAKPPAVCLRGLALSIS